jgi:hypothetical protein
MDLVTTVVFCNCTIALLVVTVTTWIVQLRKQVVALADWCDRWHGECDRMLCVDRSATALPLAANIAERRAQILNLRQLYRQQLLTLDRLQSLIAIVSVARSVLRRRR